MDAQGRKPGYLDGRLFHFCSRDELPAPPGPDYDLPGSGPNLLKNVVVFGQKSGFWWGFDPEDGPLRSSTAVGSGGILGGIEWGTSTDDKISMWPSQIAAISQRS